MEFNKNIIYYLSAAVISLVLFCVIYMNYSGSNYKKERATASIKKGYLLERFNLLERGQKDYETNKGYYVHNPDNKYFACKDCDDGVSKLCISIKGQRYLSFLIKGTASSQYSKGYIRTHQEGNKIAYELIGQSMESTESYYRDQKLSFSGTFMKESTKKQIKNWKGIFVADRIYETWKLEFDNGAYKDLYTGQVFRSS